ncbi:hypothetical protein D3C72_1965270 [compost metagenome]
MERVDLGIEPGALFLEALELLAAIFVEGGIAGRGEVMAAEAVMLVVVAHIATPLVPVMLGLFGRTAEFLTPDDIGQHRQAERPEDHEAKDHEGDGQRGPLRFDDCSVHIGRLPVTMRLKWPAWGRDQACACRFFMLEIGFIPSYAPQLTTSKGPA